MIAGDDLGAWHHGSFDGLVGPFDQQ